MQTTNKFCLFRSEMIKQLILIVGMVIVSLPAHGQFDTLFVNESTDRVALNPHFEYFNSNDDIGVDSAWFQLKAKWKTQHSPPVNFGVVNGFYWFAITIRNTASQEHQFVLRMDQPHTYRVSIYTIKDDKPIYQYRAGLDFPFHDRPIPVRYMAFPITLQANSAATVLIKVHQINSLSLPAYLVTPFELQNSNYQQNLIWGLWTGFILFCALLACIAWLIIKRSVFVWYSFYMLAAAFYGIVELGYGFQFLYPDYPQYSATLIVDAGLLTFILFVKFTQSLLETRINFKKAHRALSLIAGVFASLVVLGFFILDIMLEITPILLPLMNISILVTLCLLAYVGIKSLTTNKIVAIFYLVSYGILIGCSTFSILNVGFGAFGYFGPNPILFGYLTEAILLSVAIAFFFHRLNNERLKLATVVNAQQKEMYQQYIAGIDKERSRIAGELHDDVGSRLSYLKRLLVTHSEESSKTAHEVEVLIQDVRNLSHELAPPMAHVSGLLPLLEKLINDQRKGIHQEIKLQVHQYQETLSQIQIHQVYRIVQEALGNAIKYSQANRIDVQVFGREDEFSVTIEDNGIGFDTSTNQNGIGLNQMKIRAESLAGRLEINSRPNKGCQLILTVPITSTTPKTLA